MVDPYKGHIHCPGEELHTQPTAPNHCTVYDNNGILRINCFHQSCREVVEGYNRKLWARCTRKKAGSQLAGAISQAVPLPQVLASPLASQPGKATVALDRILREFPWSYQDIVNDPVGQVTVPVAIHHQLLLSLFPPDDILWVGWSVQQSGYPNNATNFRAAKDWMGEDECPGAFICPNAFKPGGKSRCNADVVQKRFLVVESDTLSKDDMGAVFRFLAVLGYQVKAVVDTAGKSLHGWFVHPGDADAARLKRELSPLGFDSQMFSVSQPVRLPGAVRNGKFQKLIYFNPNA
ncbi:hypothetical protein [Prosthecobacter dejongeii]|uniref:Uncharacterized protein n=1 Tax=Prosthecobacter dejongeii TaxID=48465 RepID=A0A7W8DNQ0_9BACT|nr:hypothetical protein [Prosthecobacter dejongeii]MBB5036156.1 hypothetical protein [Prosthecobacter dejongeii]